MTDKMDIEKIRIEETGEYDPLIKLFIENELEFSEEEPVPTDLVKCWHAVDIHSGDLAGGIALAKREGEFIIDGIAVEPSYRHESVGTGLLEKAENEVISRGGSVIYLVARAPEFFRKNGFITIERDEAPQFFECLTCHQFGVSCHPEVMKLTMK